MSSRGLVNSVHEKAEQIVKKDLGQAKVLVEDAAKSQAYLYPVKGILYFASHGALWKPFLSRLAPTLSVAIGTVGAMFFFTYLPQLVVLVFVHGPLAVLTTVALVLHESSAIVSLLSKKFLMHDALLDTFDATLVSEHQSALVAQGRQLGSRGDPMQRLGKILKSPWEKYSLQSLIRYFLYLPLNLIPVAGTVIFIVLQGRSRGLSVHDRYFQLLKWSAPQKREWLEKHSGAYSAFGTVATLLEMVPVASILFSFTNVVGAALWAADLEAKKTTMTESTAPGLREAAKRAE